MVFRGDRAGMMIADLGSSDTEVHSDRRKALRESILKMTEDKEFSSDTLVTVTPIIRQRVPQLSELELAMLWQFCISAAMGGTRTCYFRDFMGMTALGRVYQPKERTVRQKLYLLRKWGLIELDHRNKTGAFHKLKGLKMERAVTLPHTGVGIVNNPIYNAVNSLPFGKQAIHDIHLKAWANGIWELFSKSDEYAQDAFSKDLAICTEDFNGITGIVRIHHTDTITVILSCSQDAIPIDPKGFCLLTEILTRIEERLTVRLQKISDTVRPTDKIVIPRHTDWLLVQWHLGRDSLAEFAGDKFNIVLSNAFKGLFHVYVKRMKMGNIVRKEKQETPFKKIEPAFEEKLNSGDWL